MITIIHGHDTAESRKKLREMISFEEVDKDVEKISLDGKKLELENLVMAAESKSIVSDYKFVIIENLLQAKKSQNQENIIKYLLSFDSPFPLILWENSDIDKRKLVKFKNKWRILQFNFPAKLFDFLDSVGKETPKKSVESFHSLLKEKPAEIIFTMLIRQFRLLISVKEAQASDLGLPSWMYYKLKKQSAYFQADKLQLYYRKILNIEYQIKKGLTPLSLSVLLDLFFLNI